MKLLTYQSDRGPRAAVLLETEDRVHYIDIADTDPSLPSDLCELLALGPAAHARLKAIPATGFALDPRSFQLLPPIPRPGKILCIGLNYHDHARESGASIPSVPVVFNKVPTALIADGETIRLPRVSDRVDYEAELVVVIGKKGRYIEEKDALSHVGGYCCGNDVSARDWQKGTPAGQWFLGKTFDTFAPVGPCLVTPDEVGSPDRLAITLRLDGETMQQSRTDQLIFSVPKIIAYLSRVMTLLPGDLVFTGTPGGVGDARKPPVYLQAAQRVEVEIERIGVLTNTVGAE